MDKVRFYPEKNSEKVSALLEALNTLERTDPDSLEDVFSKHRDAVQLQFNQSLDILTCVKGFFNSPIHCRKHFEYHEHHEVEQVCRRTLIQISARSLTSCSAF